MAEALRIIYDHWFWSTFWLMIISGAFALGVGNRGGSSFKGAVHVETKRDVFRP